MPLATPRRRLLGAALAVVVVVGIAMASRHRAIAAIEGGTFTSTDQNVRVTLPRGWRVSDQAAYPRVILRMFRTRPRAAMMLAVDPLPAASALPEDCVAEATPPTQLACLQKHRLAALGFEVGAVQGGTRPWFDFADGHRQSRQGLVILGDQVFTLVLSADSAAARAQYARSFDRALRSVRRNEGEGDAAATGDATTATGDAGVGDGGVADPTP
ncbi:MAG: hypothetical protein H6709_23025 [Kofleriaceae bacterium]|nr:hypothetical protein [Myxococcales bacterium]MCB9563545.1 hypothetical protein [Kofleriaceae bacterium]MCB9574957.1 hypothetical protein [Kofleriaceae bacterium]